MYWSTNNVLSVIQTMVLKKPSVRQALDIPDAPAPENAPAMKMINPIKALSEVYTRCACARFFIMVL